MKFSTSLILAAAATIVSAQVSYDNQTDTWHCPVQNGSYCAHDSLASSIIILCTNGIGYPGNCDGHAADRPPIDVFTAPCWQISASAGNATCSKNCTVFPDSGNPFKVPGDCKYQSASPGSDIAGYAFGSNSTNSTGPYGNSTSNATVTSSRPTASPTGPSSTSGAGAAATSSSSAGLALSAGAGTSIFGAALLAVAAFAL